MKTCLYLLFTFLSILDLKAQGVPYNVEFQVNTMPKISYWDPKLVTLTDGKFVICWESAEQLQQNEQKDIYMQIFFPTGEKIGGEVRVNSITNVDHAFPDITSLSN